MYEENYAQKQQEHIALCFEYNVVRIRAIGEHTLIISHSFFPQLNEDVDVNWIPEPEEEDSNG